MDNSRISYAEWFSSLQVAAGKLGFTVTDEDKGRWYTYYYNGWSPEGAARDQYDEFDGKPTNSDPQ